MTSKTPPLAPSPSANMISSASPLNQMSDSQHPNEDLTLFVHDMLNQMSTRFSVMGDSIMGQMDQMGSRMNDLERSINELMDQAGLTPMSDTLPPSSVDSNKKPSVAKV